MSKWLEINPNNVSFKEQILKWNEYKEKNIEKILLRTYNSFIILFYEYLLINFNKFYFIAAAK